MLTAVLSASANVYTYDFYEGGICYNIISSTDKTVEVTYKYTSTLGDYYSDYSGNVIIPEQVTRGYDGITYSVTKIGDYAFVDCSRLTSVTIGGNVTTIGNHAFDGCSGLTSVTISNSVTTIDSFAFYNCSELTSITIPNSVTTIGEHAFSECRGLTSVTIPNSVTTINSLAFYKCI